MAGLARARARGLWPNWSRQDPFGTCLAGPFGRRSRRSVGCLKRTPPQILGGAVNCILDKADESISAEALLHLYNHIGEIGGKLNFESSCAGAMDFAVGGPVVPIERGAGGRD